MAAEGGETEAQAEKEAKKEESDEESDDDMGFGESRLKVLSRVCMMIFCCRFV